MDVRRRREGARRQREEILNAGVELSGRGEQAIVATAGLGGNAVGDFALNHDNGSIDDRMMVEEVQQDRRGYVVGEIADDGEFFAASEAGEISREEVLGDDLDGICQFEMLLQVASQDGVEFDSDEAMSTAGKQIRNRSFAGTDFDHCRSGDVAQGVDDGKRGGGVGEEILSEFRFAGHGWY